MTIQEALRQSGFTQEQIDAFDAKALASFGGILTAAEADKKSAAEAVTKANADFAAAKDAVAKAEQERKDAIAERERVELIGRSNTEFYETKIVPGLTGWDDEKIKLENERTKALAEAAYYRTQNEGARSGGFIPTDAPGYTAPVATDPQRGADGKYVTGGGTPGSPTFIDPKEVYKRAGDGMTMLTDINWRHQQLYGSPLPISPSQLIAEADAQKLDPKVYAEKRFNFAQRETELATQRKTEHEASLTAAAAAAERAVWEAKAKTREEEFAAEKKKLSESSGNNPDVRVPQGAAKFAEIKRAVETGELPNPLKMTNAQRHAATRQQIHAAIAERDTATV